jgi:hypothetical protein
MAPATAPCVVEPVKMISPFDENTMAASGKLRHGFVPKENE